MKKSWKIASAVVGIAVVFCLWYTWPRSFEDLAGYAEIKSISVVAIIANFEDGLPKMDLWMVDDQEGPENVGEELGALMKSCKYRASLRSLFPFSDVYSISGDKDAPIINVVAVLEDNSVVFAAWKGSTVQIETDKVVVAKATDREIGDILLSYIQEFGWKE